MSGGNEFQHREISCIFIKTNKGLSKEIKYISVYTAKKKKDFKLSY